MNKSIAVAILAVALSGGAYAQSNPPTLKEQVAMSKKNLVADFHDPESAKFRGLTGYGVKHPDGQIQLVTLCGQVNGKNLHGAYTGYKSFYIIGWVSPTIESADSKAFAYETACKGDVVYQAK